ncbi:MAG: RsmG family class I SAM-dependent methyltransferase [Acidimicrobiales bacterium]
MVLAFLEESRTRGFLGPGPLEVHLSHALGFAGLVPTSGLVLDLGAGGGVPGLILLAALPEVRLTLLEANHRRCLFLADCVEQAGWSERATVVEARAEDAGRMPGLRHQHDAVVARSFGAPAVTAECGAPFLRVSGVLVVSEPPQELVVTSERWPTKPLAELGLVRREIALPSDSPRFVVFEALTSCPQRVPRRDGMPAKRPLFQ